MSNDRATKRRKVSNLQADPLQKSKSPGVANETTTNFEKSFPSLKNLASSDPKLRRQNLTAVLSYLESCPSTQPLTHTQCLQLWRGFYVALYMHDSKNAISVQNLTATLAETVILLRNKDLERGVVSAPKLTTRSDESEPIESSKVDAKLGWLFTYITAFWETMAREWSTIDSHRLNKYLLLVRLVTRQIFKVCIESKAGTNIENEDETQPVQEQMDIFERWPLNAKERNVSDGLRLHVLDIWNDELITAMEAVLDEQRKQECGKQNGESQNAKDDVAVQSEHMGSVLKAFTGPLEKISRSGSGAQRHIRQKAKELLMELEQKIINLE